MGMGTVCSTTWSYGKAVRGALLPLATGDVRGRRGAALR